MHKALYTSYEDSTHKGTIILNGLISKYILINNDKDFKWYNNSHNGYNATPNVLNAMEAAKGKYQFATIWRHLVRRHPIYFTQIF
ncbi:MAG: hypothetical protein IPI98_12360 [Chitinophagaceae bacterium]|nr:hypothetical protein [Chitinophagaceae bacterium]